MTRAFTWTEERVRSALGLPAVGGGTRSFSGISTDTRTLAPGEIFVALRGERFDGTDFLSAAAEAGAAGAVLERAPDSVPPGLELFLVPDTLSALGQLACMRRRALKPAVVAITGTSGKTTTRALTAAALGSDAYASPGNYNNLVGVPLSMLRAPDDADVWVLEVGSNQPGEIGRLGRIVEPDVAVITSVSEGHLEGLGNLAGVMREKLSLLESLRADGRAVVSAEPEELAHGARMRCRHVETVGMDGRADVSPEAWSMSDHGVRWTWRGVEFALPVLGSHIVSNALFALVVAEMFGVDASDAASRLADAKLPPLRGEIRRVGGLNLLLDCYNANPASFRAAIESLAALAGGARRAALVGSMLELGGRSAQLHRQVARELAESGIDIIAAVGEFAEAFETEAVEGTGEVLTATTASEAYAKLAERLRGDEALLIKASRGMRFERVLPDIERDFGGVGSSRRAEKGA